MIKRERYMSVIRNFIDKPVIKVFTGMRRCGKSSLLKLTYDEILKRNSVDEKNILYFNFESLEYEFLKDYKALYKYIREIIDKSAGKFYFLFDEIQEVNKWQLLVNSLRVDFDCDIYITGSNAKLLSGELATYLAGRYVEIKVYPLDFKEYLDFAKLNTEERSLTLEDNFRNYLKYGGLPEIHNLHFKEDSIYQYLDAIYNAVILKDVNERSNIRNTALLKKIVNFIFDNVGNTFSAKTVYDYLKSQSRNLSVETIYNYLQILENAFLIQKLPRYDLKGKKFLETLEKYYVTDLGIRNSIIGFKDKDISGILENVVYLELKRRDFKVAIGKFNTTEIDFIATKADLKYYYQICYLLTEDNAKREFSPLENVKDNFEKTVIAPNKFINSQYNGIVQKNIIDFLLEK